MCSGVVPDVPSVLLVKSFMILTSRKILDQFQRFNFVQDKSFQPGRLGVPPCDSIITTGG